MGSSKGSGFDTHVPQRMPSSPGINSTARKRPGTVKNRSSSFLTHLLNAGTTGRGESGYYSIPSHWLCSGRRIPFRIYSLNTAGNAVVLCEQNRVYMLHETAQGASDRDKGPVFIDKKSSSELLYYLDDNIDEILSGPAGASEKAELFYYLAFRRTRNAFLRPTRTAVADMKQIIAVMIEQIFQDPEVLSDVFSLMQDNVCRQPCHPMVTFVHSLNVGILGTMFVSRVLESLPRNTLEEVSLGYFFHNIGMMRIPQSVLNRENTLSDGSWSFIHKHPQWGYEIMARTRGMNPEMAHIVMEHHERPDGTGYPRSLTGTDIHFFVKVCTIVDTLDALVSPRVYRHPMTLVDALKLMKERTPQEYDPSILSRLILVLLHEDLI